MTSTPSSGVHVRRTAIDLLVRINEEGAYANLALSAALDRSGLAERDRAFVTDLVYGTTRMRRACRHLVSRHRDGGVKPRIQAALDLGAYQLAFAGTPPHAAVDTTVAATTKHARGLVNAVLRRVAADVAAGIEWPDLATELSYPDWIVDELVARLGPDRARSALDAMNTPATTHVRDDGYVQDPASQFVVECVGATPGERVLDLCAAPGGKATGLAAIGAVVVAADLTWSRAGLVAGNAERLRSDLAVVASDGTDAPFAPATFDRVLVDAPCSGLGVLRRRPDARWRIDDDAPERLGELQRDLLTEAFRLTRPGGTVIYSVCTLTRAENDGVADTITGGAETLRRTLEPDVDHDGMYVVTWQRD